MNKNVSHMGRGSGKPDNTIPAFQTAIDAGYSMIELDIRKTLDNHIIIHHDETINGQPINQTNLHNLQQLKPNLPTLTQLLTIYKTQTTFDIYVWNVTTQEAYNKHNKDPRITKIITDHPYHQNS